MSLLDTASLIVTPNGYKEGKLYSVIPSDGSGDLSVTRATTATRVNSQGLVELVPYNLFGYSEDFANAYWTKYLTTVTSNVITAPNGTTTADLFISTGSGYVYSSFISLSADVYTASYYVKKNNTSWVALTVSNGIATDCTSWYNIDNQTLGNTSGSITITNRTIEDEGNGWLRLTLTISLAASGSFIFLPQFVQSNGSGSVNGDRGYIWGAQLVEGSVAKDYQKTETRLNIPRLDYSNGTCPSILVEPQRTNLITWSSSFDNSDWLKTNSATITANQTTAPDGTLTADRLNTASSGSYIFSVQTAFSLSNNTYSHSVYAKAGTQSVFTLGFGTPIGQWFATFNLTTASVTATGGSTATGTIEDAGNGWYRCVLTATLPVLTYCENQIGFTSASGNMFIWGAQLEAGSYATSYIPTTSASVTRNADVISKTGISSLIGQTEGTMYAEINFDINVNTTGSSRIQLSDGTTTNWIFIGIPDGLSGNLIRMFCNSPSGTMSEFTSSPIANGVNKIAFAYKSGSFVLYVNGTQAAASSSSITIPTCSRIDLQGQTPNQSAFERINYNSAALWKTRLTNAQLATLTTI